MEAKDRSLDLKFEATPREVVFSLMGDIEQCRQNKKTLRQIHKALLQLDDFSLSFSQLRNHYYQLRKQRCDESSIHKNIVKEENASAAVITDVLPSTLDGSEKDSSAQKLKDRVSQSESISSENVEQKPINEDPKPFARLELGGTLEQRRAIARAHFNQ